MSLKKTKIKNNFIIILVALLGSSLFSSYFQVFKDVISASGHHDFQWSPAKLVFKK